MPPPWRDASSWNDPATGTSGGGEGYFWHDFNKNSRYGSDAQLKTAAAALNQAKVKPIYDIVPNHNNRGIASFPWRHRAGRDPLYGSVNLRVERNGHSEVKRAPPTNR